MIKNIYSVFDKKAQVFSNPFTTLNHGTAIRSFDQACKDPGTELSMYPNDFTLFCIGTFDDEFGTITPPATAELITHGKESVK